MTGDRRKAIRKLLEVLSSCTLERATRLGVVTDRKASTHDRPGPMDARGNHSVARSESSRRGAVVVVQHATQPLAAQDCSTASSYPFTWHDQSIDETLVETRPWWLRSQ